ncbi:MAG: hypothetical protein ACRDFY_00420 [Candidatus Limnocylindria bacterium]
MTATTSDLGIGRAQGMVVRVRRLALAAGSILAAIGARWSAIVESGQLGPDAERSISRHTGARI